MLIYSVVDSNVCVITPQRIDIKFFIRNKNLSDQLNRRTLSLSDISDCLHFDGSYTFDHDDPSNWNPYHQSFFGTNIAKARDVDTCKNEKKYIKEGMAFFSADTPFFALIAKIRNARDSVRS